MNPPSHEHEEKEEKKEKPAPSKGSAINLRVVMQNGNEVFFKIKDTTPMGKLMNAFCDRQSVNRSQVRFMFDGERIEDHHTPIDLDMDDNDIIDAMLQQVGGK